MSTGSTNFSDSQFNTDCLDGLPAERPIESHDALLTEIHEDVQRILASLDQRVKAHVASLKVSPGSTRGRGFYLFSYRTYSQTDTTTIDPVVVGLTLTPAAPREGGWVLLDADISGESTGDSIMLHTRRTVPATRDELLRARDLARELSNRSREIADRAARFVARLLDAPGDEVFQIEVGALVWEPPVN